MIIEETFTRAKTQVEEAERSVLKVLATEIADGDIDHRLPGYWLRRWARREFARMQAKIDRIGADTDREEAIRRIVSEAKDVLIEEVLLGHYEANGGSVIDRAEAEVIRTRGVNHLVRHLNTILEAS